MDHPRASPGTLVQRTLAVVAVVFGLATLVAGTRVLLGSDPGYRVYQPLLVFNTAMGAAYLAAGIIAWLDVRRGVIAAASIVLLNAVVLAFVGWLRATGGAVADQSVGAMAFRTVLWLLLWAGFAWAARHAPGAGIGPT